MGLRRSTMRVPVIPADPRQELTAGDPDLRRRAARALDRDPGAAPLLCAQLAVETEPAVREAILTSLLAIGGDETAERLAPLLRSGDAALRNGVLDVLQLLPEPALRVVRPLLRDADPDVRLFAVTALGRLRGSVGADAEAALVAVLETEAHINVCSAAIEAVLERGARAALPALAEIAARFPDEPFIRFAAAAAARQLCALEAGP